MNFRFRAMMGKGNLQTDGRKESTHESAIIHEFPYQRALATVTDLVTDRDR